MVTDQRNKRDHHAAVISNHLEGNLPIILGLCFGFFFFVAVAYLRFFKTLYC